MDISSLRAAQQATGSENKSGQAISQQRATTHEANQNLTETRDTNGTARAQKEANSAKQEFLSAKASAQRDVAHAEAQQGIGMVTSGVNAVSQWMGRLFGG